MCVCDNWWFLPDEQVWALTETLKSDWALEMAKSVTVEMIKSTETTPGRRDKQKQPASSPPMAEGVSEDAGGDERVPSGGGDASFGSGSSAAGDRLGVVVVDELEEGGGDGEVRTATVLNESESSRGDDGEGIVLAGAEKK